MASLQLLGHQHAKSKNTGAIWVSFLAGKFVQVIIKDILAASPTCLSQEQATEVS